MIIIANGMTTIAEKHINSSLASVLTATSPIIVFLGSVLIGLEQFKLKSVLGLILGFSGVLLIFSDGLQELLNPDYRLGLIVLFIGILGWASGTLFTKKITIHSDNILLNLFYQFFCWNCSTYFCLCFYQNYDLKNGVQNLFAYVVYLGVLVQ